MIIQNVFCLLYGKLLSVSYMGWNGINEAVILDTAT